MNRVALRSARLAPALRQPGLLGRPLALALGVRPLSTVAEVSFWKSLVPKPLRSWGAAKRRGKPKVQKEWNPATFFIITFLLIGSMAIQMIALKRDFATFVRQSDVRIGLLREVVEKLQKGEEVDVEKALGTGDAEKELAWEEVLRELERKEPAEHQRRKQPEPTPAPTPAPTSESEAPPAPETGREPARSTIANKGFF